MDATDTLKRYGEVPPKPTADEMKRCVDLATKLDTFMRENAGPHDLAFAFYTSLIFSGFVLANIATQIPVNAPALARTHGQLLTDWLGENTKRKESGDDAS